MFFEMLHLKEIFIVAICHLILEPKLKIGDMIKAIFVHLFIGATFGYMITTLVTTVSSVGTGR